ncbi:DUF6160 family protein [Alcanivorax sp.]|uniref:DUF6160 family protein n=1 Tax=Alcanivorax sp. TaxID=1872427 RepID=UPI000C0DBA1E|nr:DUF6160 family protein [Alcanivorax sp.]PHR65070.1 MAG: hypothetical protein COA55_12040 [Alcanivorax sp.]
MNFKKLALAAAVAVAPMSALALEPMQDEALSSVTGQDGISMEINGSISTDVWIEDTDGLDGTGPAGFMTIEGLGVNLNNVTIDIDAGSTGGAAGANTGVLQVAIGIPNDITLTNLEIGVQGSSATAGESADAGRLGLIGDSTTVLSVGTVTLAASDLIMQLGPDAGTPAAGSSNFLELTGVVGVELSDVQLFGGTSNAGWIGAETIAVTNLDLGAGAGTNVTTANLNAAGLLLTVGDGATNVGVDISRLTLGDNGVGQPGENPLGNVYLTGLDLAGTTVAISGH